jgi:hypothetical protein
MENDELFRTTEAAARQSSGALEKLTHGSQEDLYAALVLRIKNASGGSAKLNVDDQSRGAVATGSFDAPLDIDDLPRDKETTTVGKLIFRRWSRVLHNFACNSESEDADLRDRLLNAISGKSGGGVALVAAMLVASFGLSPAVAAVIAALLAKLIVAPAADEVCKAWGKTLQDS